MENMYSRDVYDISDDHTCWAGMGMTVTVHSSFHLRSVYRAQSSSEQSHFGGIFKYVLELLIFLL